MSSHKYTLHTHTECAHPLRDSFKFLGVMSLLAVIGMIFTLYVDMSVFGVDGFEACTHTHTHTPVYR